MKCDAVFEGGGVKGLAFIGAIQETEERGYKFERIAGTSAGAITASLLAAGYSGVELEKMMTPDLFASFLKPSGWGLIPLAGKVLNILFRDGIYDGDALEKWISEQLQKKNISTFSDLPEGKLTLIASDISKGKMMVLPKDLSQYGIDPRKFSVARAVRMSCTIPYFFQPVTMRISGEKMYIVDGGLLSNYPIWLFDSPSTPRWPTFGFRLRGADQTEGTTVIRGPFSMFKALFSTMLEAHDRKYIKPKDAGRTIFIPVEGVKSTDFSISVEQKDRLIELGRDESKQFFDRWDFSSYIHQYRRLPTFIRTSNRSTSDAEPILKTVSKDDILKEEKI